jgi:hypothetical protein
VAEVSVPTLDNCANVVTAVFTSVPVVGNVTDVGPVVFNVSELAPVVVNAAAVLNDPPVLNVPVVLKDPPVVIVPPNEMLYALFTPVPPLVEGNIPLVCVTSPILPQLGATPRPPDINAFPVVTSESLLNALVDDAYKISPTVYEVWPVPPMLAATGLIMFNVKDPEG